MKFLSLGVVASAFVVICVSGNRLSRSGTGLSDFDAMVIPRIQIEDASIHYLTKKSRLSRRKLSDTINGRGYHFTKRSEKAESDEHEGREHEADEDEHTGNEPNEQALVTKASVSADKAKNEVKKVMPSENEPKENENEVKENEITGNENELKENENEPKENEPKENENELKENEITGNENELKENEPKENENELKENEITGNENELKENEPKENENELKENEVTGNENELKENEPKENENELKENEVTGNENELKENEPKENENELKENEPKENENESKENEPKENENELKENEPKENENEPKENEPKEDEVNESKNKLGVSQQDLNGPEANKKDIVKEASTESKPVRLEVNEAKHSSSNNSNEEEQSIAKPVMDELDMISSLYGDASEDDLVYYGLKDPVYNDSEEADTETIARVFNSPSEDLLVEDIPYVYEEVNADQDANGSDDIMNAPSEQVNDIEFVNIDRSKADKTEENKAQDYSKPPKALQKEPGYSYSVSGHEVYSEEGDEFESLQDRMESNLGNKNTNRKINRV